jgi:hypothetical protein
MMSSRSWLDADSIARSLHRMGVGAPGDLRLHRLPGGDLLRRQRTADPGATAIADSEPAPTPFAPPAGELGARLEAYVAWLGGLSGCEQPFVADHDGLPMVGASDGSDLMAIGSALTRLMRRLHDRSESPLGSSIALELQRGWLHLVTVESELGSFTVGVVTRRPLDRSVQRSIRDGLRRTLRA